MVAAVAAAPATAPNEAGVIIVNDKEKSVLFSLVPSLWTMGAQVFATWTHAKWERWEMDDILMVDIYVLQCAPLSSVALKHFLESKEATWLHKQAKEEKCAMLREVELAKGQFNLGGAANDNITATQAQSMATSIATPVTSMSRPRKKSQFDSTIFLKFSKPLHCTFVCLLCTHTRVSFSFSLVYHIL